jgi:hypothetical protein
MPHLALSNINPADVQQDWSANRLQKAHAHAPDWSSIDIPNAARLPWPLNTDNAAWLHVVRIYPRFAGPIYLTAVLRKSVSR